MNATDYWNRNKVKRLATASDYAKRAEAAQKRMDAQTAAPTKGTGGTLSGEYNKLSAPQKGVLGPPTAQQLALAKGRDATYRRNLNDRSPRLGQTYRDIINAATGQVVHVYKSGQKVVLKKKANPARTML